jgi:ribosomal protein L32
VCSSPFHPQQKTPQDFHHFILLIYQLFPLTLSPSKATPTIHQPVDTLALYLVIQQMAFRLSLITVTPLRNTLAKTIAPKPLITTPQFTPLLTPQSPMMMAPNAFQTQYQNQLSKSLFELCAVPKKRTSPRRKKVRAQGRWEKDAHVVYKNYQICLECRRAMLPQTVCTANKNCMSQPRV